MGPLRALKEVNDEREGNNKATGKNRKERRGKSQEEGGK
jgi:hypothetical protein